MENRTHEKTNGTFYSTPVDSSFGELDGLLLRAGSFTMGPERRIDVRFRRRGNRCGLVVACGFWVLRKFFTSSENLFVVPTPIVVLQGSVEGSKLALNNQLSDNRLVPILRAGVDPLWGEISKIDSLIVVTSS